MGHAWLPYQHFFQLEGSSLLGLAPRMSPRHIRSNQDLSPLPPDPPPDLALKGVPTQRGTTNLTLPYSGFVRCHQLLHSIQHLATNSASKIAFESVHCPHCGVSYRLLPGLCNNLQSGPSQVSPALPGPPQTLPVLLPKAFHCFPMVTRIKANLPCGPQGPFIVV